MTTRPAARPARRARPRCCAATSRPAIRWPGTPSGSRTRRCRQDVRGFLAGSLDLVLRLPGDGLPRFAVRRPQDELARAAPARRCRPGTTGPAALAEAMQRAHYPLQALLYAVALHRYLRWRLPGYDPGRNLAGVLYLFLRGMTGAGTPTVDGRPCGVFAWRPPTALVARPVSDLLDQGRCRMTAPREPRRRRAPSPIRSTPRRAAPAPGCCGRSTTPACWPRPTSTSRCGSPARRGGRRAGAAGGGAGRARPAPRPRARRPGDRPGHGDGRGRGGGRRVRAAVAAPRRSGRRAWPRSALAAVGEEEDGAPTRPLRLVGTALYLDRYWREERRLAADLRALGEGEPPDVAHRPSSPTGWSGCSPGRRHGRQCLAGRRPPCCSGSRWWPAGRGRARRRPWRGSWRCWPSRRRRRRRRSWPWPRRRARRRPGWRRPSTRRRPGSTSARSPRRAAGPAGLDAAPAARLAAGATAAGSGTTAATACRTTWWSSTRPRWCRCPFMARLVEAVRPDARLVLVGDPRQLASIEAGAVLGDIVGPTPAGLRMTPAARGRLRAATGHDVPAQAPPAGVTVGDGIVALDRVHRFGGGIARGGRGDPARRRRRGRRGARRPPPARSRGSPSTPARPRRRRRSRRSGPAWSAAARAVRRCRAARRRARAIRALGGYPRSCAPTARGRTASAPGRRGSRRGSARRSTGSAPAATGTSGARCS